ncbi:MAG: histidinol-phosphatase HisJ family protein [Clostridia bacterium]
MIDTHTHTKFSFDAKSSIEEMITKAQEMGIEYYAISDHCDYDYNYIKKYIFMRRIRLKKYIKKVTEMKEKYPFLALGIELGYSKKAQKDYFEKLHFDDYDYIINSTHTVDRNDCYFTAYFKNKDKNTAYMRYFEKVYRSLDASYPYQTISHIGYVRKNAPYEDATINYLDYKDVIDKILKKIIALDKCLEINTNTKNKGILPEREIIEKYYELGGRKISYASDAHSVDRICEGYEDVAKMVKEIGFEYWTVFRKQLPILIKI